MAASAAALLLTNALWAQPPASDGNLAMTDPHLWLEEVEGERALAWARKQNERTLAELQPALTSSQALLDWMNFFSPGNHDDRTLVAILPAPDTP
jgi:hypothetical protein